MSSDRRHLDGDLLTALRRGDQADRRLAGLLAPLRAPEAAPAPTAALATLLAGHESPAPAATGAARHVVELGPRASAPRTPRTGRRRAWGGAVAAVVLGLAAVLASLHPGDDVVVTPIDESPAASHAPRVDDGHEGRGHLGDHRTPGETDRAHGGARSVQPGARTTTSGGSGPVPLTKTSTDREDGTADHPAGGAPTTQGGDSDDETTATGGDTDDSTATPPPGDGTDGSDDGTGDSPDGGSGGSSDGGSGDSGGTEPLSRDGGDAASEG